MSDATATLALVVPESVRAALGRLAAQRSRDSGQPVSVAALLREAIAGHLGVPVPVASHNRSCRSRCAVVHIAASPPGRHTPNHANPRRNKNFWVRL